MNLAGKYIHKLERFSLRRESGIRTRSHIIAIIILIIIALGSVTLIKAATGRLWIFSSPDMEITVPVQDKAIDNTLFTRDLFFNELSDNYPDLMNTVINWFRVSLGDFKGQLTLNYILLALFLAGLYFLYWHCSQNRTVAVFASLLCAMAPQAINKAYFGIPIGSILPRDFVFALYPFLLYFFLRFSSFYARLFFFFFLGALTNIHMLAALWIIAPLYITLLVLSVRTKVHFFQLVLFVLSTSIGALPFIIDALQRNIYFVSESLILYRVSGLLSLNIASLVVLGIMFVLAGFGILVKKEINTDEKKMIVFSCAVFAIYCVAVLLAFAFPFMTLLQHQRSTSLVLPGLILFASYVPLKLMMSRKNIMKIIGFGLATFLFLSPSNIMDAASNPFGKIVLKSTAEFEQISIDAMIASPTDSRAFNDLSNWAKKNTSKNSLFLVSPLISSTFRMMSQRSIVVSGKDGGALILYHNPRTSEWYSTYQNISRIYLRNDTVDFNGAIDRYNLNYVVVDKRKNTLNYDVVYENNVYAIYGVSATGSIV